MSYSVCLIFCGISVGATLFFTSNYVVMTICSGCFGLFFASCLSLTPSLLTELVSLDEFTMAYGLILLCQGIGNLTGPPLAGDLTINLLDEKIDQSTLFFSKVVHSLERAEFSKMNNRYIPNR